MLLYTFSWKEMGIPFDQTLWEKMERVWNLYWRGAICIFPFLLFSSNHYKNRHSAFQNSWGNKLTISDDVWVLLGMYMLRTAILIWKWSTRWNAHPRTQKVCELDWKFHLQLFFVQNIYRYTIITYQIHDLSLNLIC